MKSDARVAYWFVTPMLVSVLGVVMLPLLVAVGLSFCNKYIGSPARFTGLANYRALVADPLFRRTVLNTFVYTFSSVGGKLILGLVMALVLNAPFLGRGLVRALLLLPWSVPTLVVCLAWRWMFTEGAGGILNYVLQRLHIIRAPVSWLSSVPMAMISVILVNIWRGVPFFGVQILAGLQTIDKQLYEAAEVDGANALHRFLYITLPSVAPVILIVSLLSIIWTFNDFQIVWLLTRGGPLSSTHLFATLTYETAFVGMRLGRGIAISISMLPMLAVLIFIVSRAILGSERA